MREPPWVTRRLDLEAIEAALKKVQREFSQLNAELNAERGILHNEILANMMTGYAYIDAAVATQVNLFARGHSKKILELNNIVLYGTDPQRRWRYRKSLTFNEKHFYQQSGIGELMEVYQMYRHKSVWEQAARIYLHIVSQPQLFVEGNHRSGALLMSYLLLRKGKPPFVLTMDNAKAYFDPSKSIGQSKRHSISMFFRWRKLQNYFVRLLKEQANPHYLFTSSNTYVYKAEHRGKYSP